MCKQEQDKLPKIEYVEWKQTFYLRDGSTYIIKLSNFYVFVSGAICGENSCCSSQFETSLVPESRNHTERFVKNSLSKLLSLFETRAKRFDGKDFRTFILLICRNV